MRRAWAVVAACLFACGIDVRGASLAPPADAGPDVIAPIVDAAVDVVDAGGDDDAGVGLPDAASTWCASQATHDLCDDFDFGSTTPTWTSSTQNGGTQAYSATAKTAPRSWEVKLGSPGGAAPIANLTHTIDKPTSHIVCEVDMFPVLRDTGAGGRVQAFSLNLLPTVGGKNDLVTINLHATTADTILEDGSYGFNQRDMTTLAAGDWRHVKLDLDLAGATATVSVDGVATTFAGLHVPALATSVVVTLGARDSLTYNGWTFRYDDVVCDLL